MGKLRLVALVALALAGSLFASASGLIGTDLDVSDQNVILSYGGLAVGWTPGPYGSCTISANSTNCLISGSTPPLQSSSPFFAALILFLAVVLSAAVLYRKRDKRGRP